MHRGFPILAGAVLVSGGLSFAGRPHASATVSGSSNDDRLMRAYAQVWTGMPSSQLGALGFDMMKAERLSKQALIERYMPKDGTTFHALDPSVKNCYVGPDDCTAYIFEVYGDDTVLLVQGGRVTWKMMSDSVVA